MGWYQVLEADVSVEWAIEETKKPLRLQRLWSAYLCLKLLHAHALIFLAGVYTCLYGLHSCHQQLLPAPRQSTPRSVWLDA